MTLSHLGCGLADVCVLSSRKLRGYRMSWITSVFGEGEKRATALLGRVS